MSTNHKTINTIIITNNDTDETIVGLRWTGERKREHIFKTAIELALKRDPNQDEYLIEYWDNAGILYCLDPFTGEIIE